MKKSSERKIWIFGLTVFLATDPMPAHAYIDPGILSMLSQAFFAFLFGGIAVWITKPWIFVKGLFGKKESKK